MMRTHESVVKFQQSELEFEKIIFHVKKDVPYKVTETFIQIVYTEDDLTAQQLSAERAW